MEITSVNSCLPPQPEARKELAEENTPVENNIEVPSDQEAPAEVVTVTENAGDDAKGVLRLLQQGHFKGVADVRLRINFHEQIMALEAEQAAKLTEQKSTELMNSINGEIQAFLESADLNEDLKEPITEASEIFITSATALTDEYLAAGSTDHNSLVTGFNSSFDVFVTSVSNAASGIPESTPEDPPVGPESAEGLGGVVEEEPPVAEEEATPVIDPRLEMINQFLANLADLFATGLVDLQTALDDLAVLPDISEPSGNGKAYDKFMAEYDELRNPMAPDPDETPVDMVI
jgi:hypothetical protein